MDNPIVSHINTVLKDNDFITIYVYYLCMDVHSMRVLCRENYWYIDPFFRFSDNCMLIIYKDNIRRYADTLCVNGLTATQAFKEGIDRIEVPYKCLDANKVLDTPTVPKSNIFYLQKHKRPLCPEFYAETHEDIYLWQYAS